MYSILFTSITFSYIICYYLSLCFSTIMLMFHYIYVLHIIYLHNILIYYLLLFVSMFFYYYAYVPLYDIFRSMLLIRGYLLFIPDILIDSN